MKHVSMVLIAYLLLSLTGCNTPKSDCSFIEENVSFATAQIGQEIALMEQKGAILNPRTIVNKETEYVPFDDWTSGFFPGSLWYLYKLTKDEKWSKVAAQYTETLDSVQYLTWHHDAGFMAECSYGNGYRLTQNPAYKEVLIQTAKSLSTRFRPGAGIIQSWDIKGWQAERGWTCPVIIDNMMNLELLFNATEFTGDSSFYKIAVSHADKTMEHHFREDYSSYHVIDYDPITGAVLHKHTAQGYAHESAWARGQAWGIYGYTVCYRYTKDPKYLEQACNIYNMIFSSPTLPKDLIPYWDYNAPKIPNEPRDVSAAAVTASAIYELMDYISPSLKDSYKAKADTILTNLSSENYRAKLGENHFFLLMHSVGSIPHGAEIDVPLNYADYYFLEALSRKATAEGCLK